ncbi:MAG: rRNA adenine N-6-methyltransferase family protein [Ktedonobacteraceae bacterium]
MTVTMDEDRLLREQFVHVIEQNIQLSSAVRAAFLAVPRILFVPQYYARNDQTFKWTLMSAEAANVYRDDALVTQIDARGMPSSSSSQPSLMAEMLEALAIQPGQRVLEIGTGTGYNAALLAHITGDALLVTTVELDPELADKARDALEQVGYGSIQVSISNGLQGYAPRAPYDRIIATGGYPYVPGPWIDQLAIGGKLVMDLLLPLSYGLVALDKQPDRVATGHFLAKTRVGFIQLRDEDMLQPSPRPVRIQTYLSQPLLTEEEVQPDEIDTTVFDDPTFLFYLQLEYPHLEMKYLGTPENAPAFTKYLFDLNTLTGMICPSDQHDPQSVWRVEARGQYNLWEAVKAAYHCWENLKRPVLSEYRMEVDAQARQSILLGSQRWIMREGQCGKIKSS